MDIFQIKSSQSAEFERIALDLFNFQAENVQVYKNFIFHLGINPKNIARLEDIPFLPIEFFKTDNVYCASTSPQIVFTSSATTNTGQSHHLVADLLLYENSYIKGFSTFYDNPANYCYLCLLPSYMERQGSSLVYMAQGLIKQSNYEQSGFYLNNLEDIYKQLLKNEENNIPTLFLGVSFALLNFAEHYKMSLKHTIVMETGGMKGRGEEISREDLHNILKNRLGVNEIHSEYGMTELLSQAYSKGKGIFRPVPWMKIMLYDLYNPLSQAQYEIGGINVIDLANQHSCAFIQTDDLGKILPDGSFEVLGRKNNSEIKGCNLLLENIKNEFNYTPKSKV